MTVISLTTRISIQHARIAVTALARAGVGGESARHDSSDGQRAYATYLPSSGVGSHSWSESDPGVGADHRLATGDLAAAAWSTARLRIAPTWSLLAFARAACAATLAPASRKRSTRTAGRSRHLVSWGWGAVRCSGRSLASRSPPAVRACRSGAPGVWWCDSCSGRGAGESTGCEGVPPGEAGGVDSLGVRDQGVAGLSPVSPTQGRGCAREIRELRGLSPSAPCFCRNLSV